MEKIRGVNLGNWLVLEKWMTPALFDGVDAEDETYLCARLGHDRAAERLKVHRDEFITQRDFEDIAVKGFNAVRIPVPFFLFEDVGPYIHCYEYLDKAFDWAEKFGLKILVDLHTAPGGHNGTDNSGIIGICTWSTKPEYVNYTVRVLEKIAQRYGRREAMWGIGVLNEPMCSDTPASKILNIQNFVHFYKPVDQELAKTTPTTHWHFCGSSTGTPMPPSAFTWDRRSMWSLPTPLSWTSGTTLSGSLRGLYWTPTTIS